MGRKNILCKLVVLLCILEAMHGQNKVSSKKLICKNAETFTVGQSSVEMARNMRIGWNLGNTFDAYGKKGLECESAWGQPTTTKEMIQGIKNSGFVSIRIPVSWHDHVVDSSYNLDVAWLKRIQEVVDWSLEEGLCVIINMHHDNFSEEYLARTKIGFALSNNKEIQKISINYITRVWKQIAEYFKDYDHSLVFEILNEPRDVGGKIWGNEWWLTDVYVHQPNQIITTYEQAALKVIRETGKKNADRFIMVPGYAGSFGCLDGYKLPKDTVKDRLIMEIHAYSPYSFAMESPGSVNFTESHKLELLAMFNYLKSKFIQNGIGVVIDETGATNKNNLEERLSWAEFYFGQSYKMGIPCFWWENGIWQINGNDYSEHYGFYERKTQKWYFPTLMQTAFNSTGIVSLCE